MDLVQDEIITLREKMSSLRARMEKLESLERKLSCCKIECIDEKDETASDGSKTLALQVVCLLRNEYMTLRQAMDNFPDLEKNRDFWMILLHRKPDNKNDVIDDDEDYIVGVRDIFFERAPASLFQDRELMIQACLYDFRIYGRLKEISPDLCHDREILKAALTCSPATVLNVDPVTQKEHPDLIALAIRRLPLQGVEELQTHIRQNLDFTLWRHRFVALAWLQAGGAFLENHFPEQFRDDPAMLLAYVENHKTKNLQTSFPASARLRSNKEFMLQAIELNGRLLNFISEDLVEDFDLLLSAFSDLNTVVYYGNYSRLKWIRRTKDNFEYMAKFGQQVKQKLRAYENFRLLLSGIAVKKNETCQLPLLNQGKETSLAYKKLIATYLDIPTGKKLRTLHQARDNLAFWGFK